MRRRFIRIFCVAILLLLVTTVVITQFWEVVLETHYTYVDIYFGGIHISQDKHYESALRFDRLSAPSVQKLLVWPDFKPTFWLDKGALVFGRAVFIPWWFLPSTWGLLTAVVWRFTRHRKGLGGAFPVEPTAKTSPSTDHGPLTTDHSPNDSIPR
jgi:hypothetical protein